MPSQHHYLVHVVRPKTGTEFATDVVGLYVRDSAKAAKPRTREEANALYKSVKDHILSTGHRAASASEALADDADDTTVVVQLAVDHVNEMTTCFIANPA